MKTFWCKKPVVWSEECFSWKRHQDGCDGGDGGGGTAGGGGHGQKKPDRHILSFDFDAPLPLKLEPPARPGATGIQRYTGTNPAD